MTADEFKAKLKIAGYKRGANGRYRCPGHQGKGYNLEIYAGDAGGVVPVCYSHGCTPAAIAEAVGLTMGDLFADNGQAAAKTTRYLVLEIDGERIEHVRKDYTDGRGKTFSWFRGTDPGRRVEYSLRGFPLADLPLYRSPALRSQASDDTRPVFLVEGEKCCEALEAISAQVFATVTGAAGTPGPAALAALSGCRVVLWPDNDPTGRQHMLRIARALDGIAATVRWYAPEGLPDGGDAADWVAARSLRNGADLLAELEAGPFILPPIRETVSAERIAPPPDSIIHSAAATPFRVAERIIRFRTAKEIGESADAAIEWIAAGFAAVGGLTELDGKIKASGKTTFLLHLVRAVLDGRPFLGRATIKSPVVLLTEMPDVSLRPALRRADLLGREELSLLSWYEVAAVPWTDAMAAAQAECERIGAKLLVIDTLGQFSNLKGDSENSAAAALEVCKPMQLAAAAGLGVVFSRHDRKSGGDLGDSGRGSSAISGAVDVILSLRRREGDGASNVRILQGLGRFEETPAEMVIALQADGYHDLGTSAAVALDETHRRLLDVLPASEDDAATFPELMEQLPGAKRTTVQAALAAMGGKVGRVGKGVKGNPLKYFLPTVETRWQNESADEEMAV